MKRYPHSVTDNTLCITLRDRFFGVVAKMPVKTSASDINSTWAQCSAPAPDSSFLLMQTLQASGNGLSGRVPATHMEGLD